jgi:preprotein translocase subunit YajC
MISLFLNSLPALAQDATAAAAAAPAQSAPAWMQFVPFAVILVVMYFIVIRPQATKQKETQTFLQALRVGDLVVTQAGILGRITALTDVIATLEIANQVQIKILRAQIAMSQAALQATKKEGK